MSRILKSVNLSARRLHDAGFIDQVTKRDLDALCLTPSDFFLHRDKEHLQEEENTSQLEQTRENTER